MGNHRYDMEFGGSFYPLVNFVRGVTLAKRDGRGKGDEKESGNP